MDLSLTYMNWFIIAVVLMTLEVFLPGVLLFWFGCGALIVGLILVITPLSIAVQLGLFSFFSLLFAIIVIKYFRTKHPSIYTSELNKVRGSEYIGHKFTLTDAVIDGQSRLKLGDSVWNITGIDCSVGTIIVITGINGNSLTYEIDEEKA